MRDLRLIGWLAAAILAAGCAHQKAATEATAQQPATAEASVDQSPPAPPTEPRDEAKIAGDASAAEAVSTDTAAVGGSGTAAETKEPAPAAKEEAKVTATETKTTAPPPATAAKPSTTKKTASTAAKAPVLVAEAPKPTTPAPAPAAETPPAEEVAPQRFLLKPVPGKKNAVTLYGDSTLHPFHATTTAFELKAAVMAPPGRAAEVAAAGRLADLEVRIPVTTLKSKDKGLDDNMYKALEAPKHPVIVFKLERADASGGKLKARGKLTVAGQTRDVDVTATSTSDGSLLTFKGGTELLMTQFGIKPPSMFLGTVKTADKIKIEFELNLAAGGQPAL